MALGFEDPDTLPVLVGRVEKVEGILEEPMGTLEALEGKAEKVVVGNLELELGTRQWLVDRVEKVEGTLERVVGTQCR